MNNLFYNEMIELLTRHPKGLRVGNIARALYNNHCDLFSGSSDLDFINIYRSIRFFLWQNSRNSMSPFERKGWGIYALRKTFVAQQNLTFEDFEGEIPIPKDKEEPLVHRSSQKVYMPDLFE